MNVCPKAYTISDVDSMQAAITPPLHLAPLHLAPVGTKAVDLDFDGGRLSSDAGLVLLKDPDEQLGLTHNLAAVLSDPRDPRPQQGDEHQVGPRGRERVPGREPREPEPEQEPRARGARGDGRAEDERHVGAQPVTLLEVSLVLVAGDARVCSRAHAPGLDAKTGPTALRGLSFRNYKPQRHRGSTR